MAHQLNSNDSLDGPSINLNPSSQSSRQFFPRGRSNYICRGSGGRTRGRGRGQPSPSDGFRTRGGSANQNPCFQQLTSRLECMNIGQGDSGPRLQQASNLRDGHNGRGNGHHCRFRGFRGHNGRGMYRSTNQNKQHDRHENIGNILNRLTDASASDVLGMVGDPRSSLRNFLSSREPCSNEQLARLFELFNAVTKIETAPEMSAQFIVVLTSSNFMVDTLKNFIILDLLTANESIPHFTLFLENLLDVLISCFVRTGALAEQHLSSIVILLERQLKYVTTSNSKLVKEKLMHISNMRQAVSKDCQRARGEATQLSYRERRTLQQDAQLPPDNFRQLSVFPVKADFEMETRALFLRRNLTRGIYDSAETYLDIQFRLMREDFVEPLREGVQQVMEREVQGENGRREKLDLKVYTDVHIGASFPTRDLGVVHDLKFSMERLHRVMWDKTKRFMYGSLVCLSSDNFQTIHFATIALRDLKDLQQGVVTVKFNQQVPPKLDVYVMVESSVFFEAYRHTLTRLIELHEDNFPMKDVLLGKFRIEETPPLPEYLRSNDTIFFDLSVLVEKKLSAMYSHVYPRRNNTWPNHSMLGMDRSQFAAFKNALTRDVALIQGPPGCGKTFVGLKIVQTLLGVTSKYRLGPILIVCYTNHALDQFLEGILRFCPEGMVRVGQGSKSEKIEKVSLSKWRARKENSFRGVARNLYEQLEHCETQILNNQRSVEKSQKAILSLQELGTVIPERMKRDILKCAKKPTAALTNWLLGIDTGQGDVDELTMQCCENLVEAWLWQEISACAKIILQEICYNVNEVENYCVDAKDNFEEELRDVFGEQLIVSEAKKRFKQSENRNVLAEFESESGWCAASSRKSLKNMVQRRLRGVKMMTSAEAAGVGNVLSLNNEQRWRLYKFWRLRFLQATGRRTEAVERRYEPLVAQLQEMRQMQDMAIFQKAKVVGMTTTAAGRYGRVLSDLQPRIVVVEEVAEVLESHIVTALSRGTQHVILIGDHKQLRPNNAVYRLARNYNLDVSLFERLVNCKYPYDTLALQHRMRPEIAVLMQHIYKNLGNHLCVETYPHVPGIANDAFFFHHENPEVYADDTSSYSNPYEAKFIAALCRHLLLNGYEASRITVLTLYSGQMFTIQRCMPKKDFDGVRIIVVDSFQGEENDIILLSLVRSNNLDKIGFLDRENRVCVALSRAKMGLFVIRNLELLSRTNDLWSKLVGDMRKSNNCGNMLRLVCQMHPEDGPIDVRIVEDFKKAPEGGCSKACNTRLECGHTCRRACHPMDREHELYECLQSCPKMCRQGWHPCPLRCYQECGPCRVLVEAVMPKCGHIQKVACSDDLEEVVCLHPCEKKLKECQHLCQSTCGKPCTTKCSVSVTVTLPFCEHTNIVACHLSRGDLWTVECNSPCKVTRLPCGHSCKGTCGGCASGRLHQDCLQKVKKVLVCGHEMNSECSQEYVFICNKMCLKTCEHNKECSLKCGQPCEPCKKPCFVHCEHRSCKRKCSEPCDVRACDEPCKIKFPCKQCRRIVDCVGLCGEVCPRKCRKCDQRELATTEGEPQSRYLLLPQCNHVVKVSRMDEHVKSLMEQDVLQALTCPHNHCKKPITKCCSHRYNTELNTIQRLQKLALKSVLDVVSPHSLSVQWTSIEFNVGKFYEALGLSDGSICTKQAELLSDSKTTAPLKKRSKILLECLKQVSSVLLDFAFFSTLTYLKSESTKTHLELHIKRSLMLWASFVVAPTRTFGRHSVEAFKTEFLRLQCLVNFHQLRCRLLAYADKKAMEDLQVEVDMLMRAKYSAVESVMTCEQMNACLKRLEIIGKQRGIPALKAKRSEIIPPMVFTKGHWFKCSYGHVYAIASGNPGVKCPECSAG